jgi:malate dehydrogenase (oxaloacetate-decarboxylating)(NADP+)
LFPDLGAIREISAQIAVAVGEVAFEEGLTAMERPADLMDYVKRRMFYPCYVPYEAV